jgi:hypothetical protein
MVTLSALYPSGSGASSISISNLIFYLKFEEASGSRLSSMGTLSFALIGSPTRDTGINNFAVGLASGQALSGTTSISATSEFSFSYWIYPTSNANIMDIIDHRRSPNNDFAHSCAATTLVVNMYHWKSDGTAQSYDASNALNLNQWNFVAFSGDFNVTSSTAFFNVNGTQTTFTPINKAGTSTASIVDIGQYANGSRVTFNGRLDEMTYWARTLTFAETEILRNLNYAFSIL